MKTNLCQVYNRQSKELEATTGFEPVDRGFADPRLNHLATSPQNPRTITWFFRQLLYATMALAKSQTGSLSTKPLEELDYLPSSFNAPPFGMVENIVDILHMKR